MKNITALLLAIAILAGCATAPLVVGPALQITACELAKARPAAAVPLLAAGETFLAYASQEAPTGAQLAAALAAVPALAGYDAAEVRAFVDLVLIGYAPLYASIETDADKARLRLWFRQVGSALVSGSQCKPAVAPAGSYSMPREFAPGWVDLAKTITASMDSVR